MKSSDFQKPYRIIDGKRYPRVSAILNVISKPWKEPWQRRVGFEEADRITAEASDVGSKAHDLLSMYIRGEIKSLTEQPLQIQNCINAFLDWEKLHKPIWIESELDLCHPDDHFCGRADAVIEIDGVTGIMDFKTSKRITKEHRMQVSAYNAAVAFTNGYFSGNRGWILRLDKETGEFDFELVENLDYWYQRFLSAKDLWVALRAPKYYFLDFPKEVRKNV